MSDDLVRKAAGRRQTRTRRLSMLRTVESDTSSPLRMVPIDAYRQIVFPNRIREQRLRHGRLKLLAFAATIPDIPYIRLSKIERGEVLARADELVRIAGALGITPAELLIDVASPDFDVAEWFARFTDGAATDDADEVRVALLLAAAVRFRRANDPRLTGAVLDTEFGIAPVILSRIENARKGLSRWNAEIVGALCRLFDVPHEQALRDRLREWHDGGVLDRALNEIPGSDERRERTRQRIAALAREVEQVGSQPPQCLAPASDRRDPPRRSLMVHGVPAADGTIAMTPSLETVEAPAIAGPRAYAVRVGRATLGPGLPGQATVIVDPDRYPQAGGLALVRQGEAWRIVSVLVDRTGALVGYSLHPEREVAIDTLDRADLATGIAAQFV